MKSSFISHLRKKICRRKTYAIILALVWKKKKRPRVVRARGMDEQDVEQKVEREWH